MMGGFLASISGPPYLAYLFWTFCIRTNHTSGRLLTRSLLPDSFEQNTYKIPTSSFRFFKLRKEKKNLIPVLELVRNLQVNTFRKHLHLTTQPSWIIGFFPRNSIADLLESQN